MCQRLDGQSCHWFPDGEFQTEFVFCPECAPVYNPQAQSCFPVLPVDVIWGVAPLNQ